MLLYSTPLILDIVINIKDSNVKINQVSSSLKDFEKQSNSASKTTVSLSGYLQNLGLRFQGFNAILSIAKTTLGEFVKKYNEFSSASLGLESISKFKGIDPSAASSTINSLTAVRKGLISVSDASTALKNLLSANFTLRNHKPAWRCCCFWKTEFSFFWRSRPFRY